MGASSYCGHWVIRDPGFLFCMPCVHVSSDKDDTTCSQNLQELDTVKKLKIKSNLNLQFVNVKHKYTFLK